MPNWCSCDFYIQGADRECVREVLNYIRSESDAGLTTFDFNKVIPYPEEWRLADEANYNWRKENPGASWADAPLDGFNHGGYEWCTDNWGTKWSLRGEHLLLEWLGPNTVTMSFDTAWSPPLPVIKALGETFPNCRFKLDYYEAGCAYQGHYQVEGGEVITDDCDEYHGPRGG